LKYTRDQPGTSSAGFFDLATEAGRILEEKNSRLRLRIAIVLMIACAIAFALTSAA
jgi:hypothetical protein